MTLHAQIAAEAAAGFAARCAKSRDFAPLHAALDELRKVYPFVRELAVYDAMGRVVSSSDLDRIGASVPDFDGPWADVASQVLVSPNGERLLEVTAPIFDGDELWGSFRSAVSLAEIDAAARMGYAWSLGAAAAFAALGCLGSWALGRLLRNDARSLAGAVERLGADPAPGPAPLEEPAKVSTGELEPVARALRRLGGRWMAVEKKRREEVAALEERLAVRTKALEEAEGRLGEGGSEGKEATVASPSAAGAAPSSGFTLIELMIVVAIISIVVAMAMPSLTGSRKSANETSALGTLRAIAAACEGHREKYRAYPTSLRQMMLRGYVDQVVGSGIKSGYRFSYARQNRGTGWYARATPRVRGTTGDRSFFTDHTGVLRVAQRGNATAKSPPLD